MAILTKDTLPCKLCIEAVDIAYQALDSGASKEAIEDLLDAICLVFPNTTAQQECATFINQEYDELIAWLEVDFSSEILCTLMGACEYPVPPINGACDGCMIGFTLLEDIWSYGPTDEMFYFVLDLICNIFPEGDIRSECEQFMNVEFDQLIVWIDATFPPEYICTMLNACAFPVNPVDDGLCIFCKGAFQFVYDAFEFDIQDGNQLAELVLDYICYMFPENSTERAECNQFIDQEYDELVGYLENEFPVENVCILAGACDSNITPNYSTECEFCVILYQFALDMLNFDASMEAIEHLLENICQIFPDSMVTVCDAFIDKFYEKLIEMLNQKLPTDVACEAMGACSE